MATLNFTISADTLQDTPTSPGLEYRFNECLRGLRSHLITGIEFVAGAELLVSLTAVDGAAQMAAPFRCATFTGRSMRDVGAAAAAFLKDNPTYFFSPLFCRPEVGVGKSNVRACGLLIYSANAAEGDAHYAGRAPSGPAGPLGPIGPTGPQGERGAQGPAGPKGEAGPVGPSGGPAGPQGERGSTGEAGPQGERGLTGSRGEQGVPGPIGPQGLPGETGPQGSRGLAGPRGEQGTVGPAGPRGEQGVTGQVGPRGEQGTVGPAGPTGPAGPVGATGPIGPVGPQGARGEVGPQGLVGPRGEAGPQGDRGARGEAGPQGERGPVGPLGPQGSTGPRGEAGPQGPQGDVGPAGARGERGPGLGGLVEGGIPVANGPETLHCTDALRMDVDGSIIVNHTRFQVDGHVHVPALTTPRLTAARSGEGVLASIPALHLRADLVRARNNGTPFALAHLAASTVEYADDIASNAAQLMIQPLTLSASGPQTVDRAASVIISGAAKAGENVTLREALSLLVLTGATRLQSLALPRMTVRGNVTIDTAACFSVFLDSSDVPAAAFLPKTPIEGTMLCVKWVAGSEQASIVCSAHKLDGDDRFIFARMNQSLLIQFDGKQWRVLAGA